MLGRGRTEETGVDARFVPSACGSHVDLDPVEKVGVPGSVMEGVKQADDLAHQVGCPVGRLVAVGSDILVKGLYSLL